MGIVNIAVSKEEAYSNDYTVNTIFSKLDEAISDLENGKVLSEDEVWKDLDAI